ncbi:MAG: CHASE2 domain-containing protein [Richelia sp. SM1_7_0]|nr:CHASE2 domain-containing protein [Richelia sp. SM1_7_0]
MCQHWSVKPPTWEELRNPPDTSSSHQILLKTGVILSGLLLAIAVIGIRSFGLLQTLEFKAFDTLMKIRPNQGVDSRLLIVEATETDINRWGYPIPDSKLAQTIETIQQHQPSIIGLFIFRDTPLATSFANRPVEPGHQNLLKLLQNNDRLVALCSIKLTEDNPNQPGISPLPEIPEKRLGFSNLELDKFDNILRRNLLFIHPELNNPCPTRFSFSFQLASKYLESKGIKAQTIDRNRVKIGETIFKRLQENSGGYHQLDNRGFQILLNYRTSKNIATKISLSDVLDNKFNPELIKKRIVIIGVVAEISNPTDYFSTPYSNGALFPMSGVDIQAQMTSQIISAVLDKRPLLWTWSQTGEILWVVIWSLAGSGIVIASLSNRNSFLLFIYIGTGVSILCLVCFIFFLQGGWIPLVPTAISLSMSSITGYLIANKWKYFNQKFILMKK